MQKTYGIRLTLLLLALLFALLVWPTPWRYDRLGQTPVRTNRFTGNVQHLTLTGWTSHPDN